MGSLLLRAIVALLEMHRAPMWCTVAVLGDTHKIRPKPMRIVEAILIDCTRQLFDFRFVVVDFQVTAVFT